LLQEAIGRPLCKRSSMRLSTPVPGLREQSDGEGYYVGLGGGLRSTVCDNWRTREVESFPGVNDRIGLDPDACFSKALRLSAYVGYRWKLADRWMAGVEADVG